MYAFMGTECVFQKGSWKVHFGYKESNNCTLELIQLNVGEISDSLIFRFHDKFKLDFLLEMTDSWF